MSVEPRWPVPRGWAWTLIKSIAEVTGGGTPSAHDPSNFSDNGGTPWVTPADLTGYGDTYITRGRRNLSDSGYKSSSAKLLPAGSVLFTSRAPIGYCAIASNPIATNQGFKSLTLFGGISGEFTRHYLKWSKPYLESLASGTTFLELSGSKFQQVPFPLPPLAEQKRIVAKLNTLNARSARARTELARIETLVSRYKQALLSKAFSGELTREWRSPNSSVLLGSNTQTDLNLDDSERGVWSFNTLPEQWVWKHFDEMFIDITDGKRKLPQKEYLSEGLYPVVDQGAAKVGGYTDQHELLHPASAPYIVFGDHTRSVKYIEGRFVQGADGVKVFHSVADVSLSFAFLALSTVELPNKGYSRHMKFVRSTIFPVAPLDEQHEIVRRIESAFSKIDRVAIEAKHALALVGRLDETILSKAFRGGLVPQDENDEPAEHLLVRIRAEREAVPKVKKRVERRTSAMTARDFLNAKLSNWPHDGISFQDLRSEFSGSYDDLKDALFILLSDGNAPLRQVFDEQRSVMTIKRREQ